MSKALVICSALCVCVSLVYTKQFGSGVWERLYISKCEDDSHKFKFDMALMKINDTHNGFKGHIVFDEDFDESFGIRLEICKIVDDSCKQSQVLVDDCLMEFFDRYVRESVVECMKAAGLDPAAMPIPKGEYEIESYAFNNEPTSSMYGTFNFKAIVLQGDEEVGCLETRMEFKKIDDDDDEEKEEK